MISDRRHVRISYGHITRAAAVVIGASALIGACAHRGGEQRSSASAPLYAPEARSDHGMVSTGSVEATGAGVRILEKGGNAVDAAVAAAFALGVADPGGSGLGGMTYILISPARGRAVAIDGSATVPLSADPATGVFSGVGDPRRNGFALGPRTVPALER